jgi:hypothetical protein
MLKFHEKSWIIRRIEANIVQIQSRQSRGHMLSTRDWNMRIVVSVYTVIASSCGAVIFLATAAWYRDNPTHASVLNGPVSQARYAQTNDTTRHVLDMGHSPHVSVQPFPLSVRPCRLRPLWRQHVVGHWSRLAFPPTRDDMYVQQEGT